MVMSRAHDIAPHKAAFASNDGYFIVLQYEAAQPSCRIGSGVNIDAVAPNIHGLRWSVSVHNDLAKVLVMTEELLANPKQIVLTLPIEGNSGAYSRVREEVVAAREG